MLRIRAEQSQAFQDEVERQFVRRLIDHLRQEHTELTAQLDDTTVASRVWAGLKTAREIGITQEDSIALFVVLQFNFGQNFYRHPKCKRCLSQFSPDEAVDQFTEVMTDSDWEEAEQLSRQMEGEAG